MDQEQRHYERAHARVQAIKGFYIHASAIVVVNIALLASVVVFGSPLTLCSSPTQSRWAPRRSRRTSLRSRARAWWCRIRLPPTAGRGSCGRRWSEFGCLRRHASADFPP